MDKEIIIFFNIYLFNVFFQTPLHLSAEHGHSSNVKSLLQHDADMLVRDINGLTASDLADKAGHINCTNILKEAYSK